MSNMKSKKMMKSTNILNQRRFKAKKSLKTNFRSNWIEKEEDDDDDSTIDLKFIDRNQDRDSLQIENLQRLSTMKHLIFLDLENFSSFFQHLTQPLPMLTYVMAFQGIHFQWKPPINHSIFDSLVKSKEFQLMYPSGSRHDAADFALVLSFGKLHGLLPKSIPFTIISGDKGFLEIIHQLKTSQRRINWFNPHETSFDNLNQILIISSN